MKLLRGTVPTWAGSGSGSGYGYGDGYGDGSGYGDGYGDGSGCGCGSAPSATHVSVHDLEALGACSSGVSLFVTIFPDGAQWPRDRNKALVAGLDVAWFEQKANQ